MSRVKITKVETEQKVSPPRIIFIIPPKIKSVPIIEDVEALCKRLEFRL